MVSLSHINLIFFIFHLNLKAFKDQFNFKFWIFIIEKFIFFALSLQIFFISIISSFFFIQVHFLIPINF